MKKVIQITTFAFGVLVFLLILSTKVNANSINQITMDVYIDKSGNATVTEVWSANLTQGTEGYRIYGDLNKSSISNFTVSDDSGRTYETLPNWNVNDSFSSKAYKCGIHDVSNGIELCWGISNYGTRTYILKYDINDFVTQYSDAQGIYFNFLDLDQKVNNAKITIRSDTLFSTNNAKIWAFGYNGTINFNNGNIVLDSEGSISTSQYMVALVKFEDDIFSTNNTSKLYFKNIYDIATYKVEQLRGEVSPIDTDILHSALVWSVVAILLVVIGTLILTPIIAVILKERADARKRKKFLALVKYGEYGKRLPDMREIEYYRDIPCNGDLGYAYWLCVKYSIISEKTLRRNIVGSILLKWIKNGYITILKTDKRFIYEKK